MARPCFKARAAQKRPAHTISAARIVKDALHLRAAHHAGAVALRFGEEAPVHREFRSIRTALKTTPRTFAAAHIARDGAMRDAEPRRALSHPQIFMVRDARIGWSDEERALNLLACLGDGGEGKLFFELWISGIPFFGD